MDRSKFVVVHCQPPFHCQSTAAAVRPSQSLPSPPHPCKGWSGSRGRQSGGGRKAGENHPLACAELSVYTAGDLPRLAPLGERHRQLQHPQGHPVASTDPFAFPRPSRAFLSWPAGVGAAMRGHAWSRPTCPGVRGTSGLPEYLRERTTPESTSSRNSPDRPDSPDRTGLMSVK